MAGKNAKEELDGKMMRFMPHEDAGCFMNYFFWPATCPCIGAATMVQKFDDDKHGMGHKAMLCGGIAPMSPCPCCAYCGVGPCAAEWRFIKDPADPTKWNATGSVFACQTCEMCTNHAGDTFVFDENHTGTKEKPLEMVAGMNPMNPPCLAGKKVLKFYIVTDRKGTAGGAPDAVAMER